MSMPDEDPFTDIVAGIITLRRKQGSLLNPDWIAAETMREIDPELVYSPIAHEGMRFHCRHIACGILGIDDSPKSKSEAIKQVELLRAASQAFSAHAAALAKWERGRKSKSGI
jgi:hypothetical protein